jgi:uncharacterized protein YndB with AHSA1/START domain
MTDARVLVEGERPVIRFERHLVDPPEVVWQALTDRAQLKRWFPCDIITDEWKVGAALKFEFREGKWPPLAGRVLECDEPRVLAFTWGEETLRFELMPESTGATLLILTDELDRGFAARNAAGWAECLDLLEGRPEQGGGWKLRFDHYVAAFERVLGHQEGPPPGFEHE